MFSQRRERSRLLYPSRYPEGPPEENLSPAKRCWSAKFVSRLWRTFRVKMKPECPFNSYHTCNDIIIEQLSHLRRHHHWTVITLATCTDIIIEQLSHLLHALTSSLNSYHTCYMHWHHHWTVITLALTLTLADAMMRDSCIHPNKWHSKDFMLFPAHIMSVQPSLHPLARERFPRRSPTTEDHACLDMGVGGLWEALKYTGI